MKTKQYKSFIISFVVLFILVPIIIFISQSNNSNYLLPSFMIIFVSFLPFVYIFEKKKIRVREIVLISSMSAIAVLGRIVFFFVPQIKATSAIIIVSAATLGSEAGFFIGVVSAFVSNFFFGQGSYTIWQMFAFGMVGFLSGIIFKSERIKNNRILVCIIGFILTFLVYGGVVNFHSLVLYTSKINFESFKAVYLLSLPFDFIHALSTSVFLWFIQRPFFEKIDRIKEKYGIIYHR